MVAVPMSNQNLYYEQNNITNTIYTLYEIRISGVFIILDCERTVTCESLTLNRIFVIVKKKMSRVFVLSDQTKIYNAMNFNRFFISEIFE